VQYRASAPAGIKMRVPTPSFLSELTVFRNGLHPPRKPGSRGPDGLGNRNSADMELLGRWISEDRAEEVWETIAHKAPTLLPTEFIQAVLKARRSAGASVNRTFGTVSPKWRGPLPSIPSGSRRVTNSDVKNPGFNDWFADLRKRIAKRLSAPRASTSPIEIAEFLEDAAGEVRDLHRRYFGFSDQVTFRLKRQGSNDDRSRAAFYVLMSAYFQKHCGGKHYAEIAVLAEIAFPGKEVDEDDVIDALKVRTSKR
jgi:hypothetical protein